MQAPTGARKKLIPGLQQMLFLLSEENSYGKALSAKEADSTKEVQNLWCMRCLSVGRRNLATHSVTSEFISTVMYSNKKIENCDESRKPIKPSSFRILS
jgi:hypothetical protein